jgi:hypothetical protein
VTLYGTFAAVILDMLLPLVPLLQLFFGCPADVNAPDKAKEAHGILMCSIEYKFPVLLL